MVKRTRTDITFVWTFSGLLKLQYKSLTFNVLTGKMHQVKYNKTQNTVHVKCQLLHLLTASYHPQGVY